jgi:hypothetical protein
MVEGPRRLPRLRTRQGEADTLGVLGRLWIVQDRLDKAVACYQVSVALHHSIGDGPAEARVLGDLATAYKQWGSWERVMAACHQCLNLCRDLDDG